VDTPNRRTLRWKRMDVARATLRPQEGCEDSGAAAYAGQLRGPVLALLTYRAPTRTIKMPRSQRHSISRTGEGKVQGGRLIYLRAGKL